MTDIRQYAKIGLSHHMLYPHCMADPEYHLRTLEEVANRDDIETLDCCVPFGDDRRKRALRVLRNCGKEIVFAPHVLPIRKVSFSSTWPHEQGLLRLAMEDQIELASAAGAVGYIVVSGPDVQETDRPEARKAFADFCRWACGELKKHGMVAMLEPLDRSIDKKFLYGPTDECAELVESLRPDVDNLGIELDVAHIPLMGESFEHAVKTVAPYLVRVHLGNCVLKDTSHPWYGDQHPAIGIDGGEIDIPELAEILELLAEVGYLSKERRGPLVLEVQPFSGTTAEETVIDNIGRLELAWQRVAG